MISSKSALTGAWVALVLITLASYLVADSDASATRVGVVVVVAAVLKGHTILDHFMGARWFPTPWRTYFAVWLVVCGGIVAASALVGS